MHSIATYCPAVDEAARWIAPLMNLSNPFGKKIATQMIDTHDPTPNKQTRLQHSVHNELQSCFAW